MNELAARRTGRAASVRREPVFSPPGRALRGAGRAPPFSGADRWPALRGYRQAERLGGPQETGNASVEPYSRLLLTVAWEHLPGRTYPPCTPQIPKKNSATPPLQPPSTGEGRKPRESSPPRGRVQREGSPSRACAPSASSSRERQVWLSGSVFRVEVLRAGLVGRRSPC